MLEGDLTYHAEDLRFWKHRETPYCNLTLINQDSKASLVSASQFVMETATDASIRARDLASEHYEKDLMPLLAPLIAKVKDLYEEHIAEIVEDILVPMFKEKVLPVYEEKVLPVYEEHVVTAYRDLVTPAINDLANQAKMATNQASDAAVQTHRELIRGVQTSSRNVVGLVDDAIVPSAMTRFIEKIEKNAEDIVDLTLMITAGVLLFIFRSNFLQLAIWVLMMPFRIFWFFCPLRFFVGNGSTKQPSKKEVKGSDEKLEETGGVKSEDTNKYAIKKEGNGEAQSWEQNLRMY